MIESEFHKSRASIGNDLGPIRAFNYGYAPGYSYGYAPGYNYGYRRAYYGYAPSYNYGYAPSYNYGYARSFNNGYTRRAYYGYGPGLYGYTRGLYGYAPVSIETVCNSKRKAPRKMRGFLFTGGELSPSLANACRARERTAAMPRHRDR